MRRDATIAGTLCLALGVSGLMLATCCQAEGTRGLKIKYALGAQPEKTLPRYHAVIVAINDYAQWNDLVYPERDARRIAHILRESYGFDRIDELYGEKASLRSLRRKLSDLSRKSTADDAILFFFAGHGKLVERGDARGGYLVPYGGSLHDASTWLAYKEVREFLKKTRARQVLLISDSCYAGAALATRGATTERVDLTDKEYAWYGLLSSKPSRYVLTSGNLEQVPDESVFAEQFTRQLESTNLVFSAAELAGRLQKPVFDATGKQVRCGEMQGVLPEQDGQFIFVQLKPVLQDALLIVRARPAKAKLKVKGANAQHTKVILGDEAADDYVAVHSIRCRPGEEITVSLSARGHVGQRFTCRLESGEKRPREVVLKRGNIRFGG
ncbi:MAG: caspase family protein [Verrucomicrobia bacterium]|jgi:hypothetical protein|nr:caspase family protein [Verrucomicrobiota bacterium]MBT7069122.1 caspase family protein [Verrucomicrobiota bacterium]MBT7699460.1 caspase family protein [Verrucomicrobiota bacterium]